MSNSTQVVDLFRWAARNGKAPRAKQPKRVGLAAALAVICEKGRTETTRDAAAGELVAARAVNAAPAPASAPRLSAVSADSADSARNDDVAPLVAVRRLPTPTTAAVAAMDERVRCPRCGREGFVHADFGLRRVHGKLRAQSWCRSCRAERGGTPAVAAETPKPAEPVRLDDLPLWSAVH